MLDGRDHRGLSLVVRKAALKDALRGAQRIVYASHFENSPAELWASTNQLELEGIVAKDGASIY